MAQWVNKSHGLWTYEDQPWVIGRMGGCNPRVTGPKDECNSWGMGPTGEHNPRVMGLMDEHRQENSR